MGHLRRERSTQFVERAIFWAKMTGGIDYFIPKLCFCIKITKDNIHLEGPMKTITSKHHWSSKVLTTYIKTPAVEVKNTS